MIKSSCSWSQWEKSFAFCIQALQIGCSETTFQIYNFQVENNQPIFIQILWIWCTWSSKQTLAKSYFKGSRIRDKNRVGCCPRDSKRRFHLRIWSKCQNCCFGFAKSTKWKLRWINSWQRKTQFSNESSLRKHYKIERWIVCHILHLPSLCLKIQSDTRSMEQFCSSVSNRCMSRPGALLFPKLPTSRSKSMCSSYLWSVLGIRQTRRRSGSMCCRTALTNKRPSTQVFSMRSLLRVSCAAPLTKQCRAWKNLVFLQWCKQREKFWAMKQTCDPPLLSFFLSFMTMENSWLLVNFTLSAS